MGNFGVQLLVFEGCEGFCPWPSAQLTPSADCSLRVGTCAWQRPGDLGDMKKNASSNLGNWMPANLGESNNTNYLGSVDSLNLSIFSENTMSWHQLQQNIVFPLKTPCFWFSSHIWPVLLHFDLLYIWCKDAFAVNLLEERSEYWDI